MNSEARKRVAALTLLMYVLETDFKVSPDRDIIQDIIAESWCLRNGYSCEHSIYADLDTDDLVKMLLSNNDKHKVEERAWVLMCATKHLECDDSAMSRG